MKKLLFALTLLSITPLCAMEKEKLTAQEQETLDTELNDLMPQEWSQQGITKIKILLKKGANPNATHSGSIPCLSQSSNPRVTRMLLHYGADLLQPDNEGNTVFHYDSTSDHLALLLLYAQEYGLDTKKIASQKNNAEETPLLLLGRHIAEQEASLSILPDLTRRSLLFSGVRKRMDGYDSDDSDNTPDDDVNSSNDSCSFDDSGIPTDLEKRFLMLTDPNTYIPLFCPDVLKQFKQEQIRRKLKKSWTIYQTGLAVS